VAGAVESAALVLVCMSPKYKLSANCRIEAEYLMQQKKEFIPLVSGRVQAALTFRQQCMTCNLGLADDDSRMAA
jgi:hypothetical protein